MGWKAVCGICNCATCWLQVEEVRVGVEKLGFNKLWGSVLLASWIVVLVLVVSLALLLLQGSFRDRYCVRLASHYGPCPGF